MLGVIGRVLDGMVVGDVSFATVGCGERLCLVVLRGEACLEAGQVVGRRYSGYGECKERSVGIVTGR